MSVVSGTTAAILQYDASKKASKAEKKAAKSAAQAQMKMYYQSRDDLTPWRESGSAALRQILSEMGLPDLSFETLYPELADAPVEVGEEPTRDQFNKNRKFKKAHAAWDRRRGYAEDYAKAQEQYEQRAPGAPGTGFRETPGYQFRVGEGVKALERGAASRGKLLSGQQSKNLVRFGQDIASQEYGNWMNRLFSTAGLGQSGAQQQSGQALQTGTNLANINLLSGQARASGYRERGNIWGNYASQQGQNAMMAALAAYLSGGASGGAAPTTLMV